MSEIVPPPPPAPPSPKVDLSWTALLWIAIIVGICTGSGSRSDKKELRELKSQLERLEKKVDQLSAPARP